jgi:hypothetical protein
MKRFLIPMWSLAAVMAAAVGILWGAAFQTRDHKAFMAISQMVELDPAFNQVASRVDSDSFWTDGSSMHMAISYNHEPLGWRQVVDLKARKRITIDSGTLSMTTYPLSSRAVELHQRLNKCEGQALASPGGTRLGYAVLKVTKTTGGTFKETTDSFVAPALDCFPLKIDRTMRGEHGEVIGRQITTTLQVIEGERPRSALAVEPDYAHERAPSTVRGIEAAATGIKCKACEENSFRKLDQAYVAAQANK